MGFRLGHRMVKVWRWLKRSRKPRGYVPLQLQDRKSRKIKRRLRMGSSKPCGGCPNFSDSLDIDGESCVSLLHSPQSRAKENHHDRQFHLPHLELQRLKIFQWHFYLPHIGYGEKNSPKHVPKGYLAVYVGQGEEPHRFVVPAVYFNHPLFGELLKPPQRKLLIVLVPVACRVEEEGKEMGKLSAMLCVVLVVGMMGYSIAQAPAGSPLASPKLSPAPSPEKAAPSPSPSAAPAVTVTAPAPALSITPTPAEAPGPSTASTSSSGVSAMGSQKLAVFGTTLLGGVALLL